MSMKENLLNLRTKLKLDSHHATERFGVIFAAFAVGLALLTTGAISTSVANGIQKTSETALYTPSFTTSKTGLSGSVAGVYVSKDRTRSLVLMQFANTASSAISADANNYQSFLTASDLNQAKQSLNSKISGQFVVFGTTGYLGVVLDSATPFSQQILNLTVRANSQLVYKADDSVNLRADLKNDKSFREYDQWRVYVNPGASQATVTDAIPGAGSSFSPAAAYYDLVVKPKEEDARKSLDDSLAKMKVDLAKITEYTTQMATTQVGNVSIVPPAVPVQIAGDKITGGPGTGKDGKPDAPLALQSKWTAPTGYSFDWRSGTVQKGYLDQLVPKGESYVSYLSKKAAAGKAANGSENTTPSFSTSALQWKLSDGTDLAKDYRDTNGVMKPLLDLMNNLSQAYQTYYDDKIAYQTKGYNSLISLEVDLKNVDSSSTTNTKDNAVLTY
ncbi:MAG TPA: hypothetical protein VFU07_05225 [Candidatus Lumbricidophila sp.]|nr:hypothetical protein [Candidatus Lumbricidophila sp.]